MAPDLDEQRLRLMWRHHVRPLLDEYFAGQPGRSAAYDLDGLLDGDPRGGERKRQPATGVVQVGLIAESYELSAISMNHGPTKSRD